jgi:hypothetical protein
MTDFLRNCTEGIKTLACMVSNDCQPDVFIFSMIDQKGRAIYKIGEPNSYQHGFPDPFYKAQYVFPSLSVLLK